MEISFHINFTLGIYFLQLCFYGFCNNCSDYYLLDLDERKKIQLILVMVN